MKTYERQDRDKAKATASVYGMWWDCAAYVYLVPDTMAEVETLLRDKGRYREYEVKES